jgi:hypothetical protein
MGHAASKGEMRNAHKILVRDVGVNGRIILELTLKKEDDYKLLKEDSAPWNWLDK